MEYELIGKVVGELKRRTRQRSRGEEDDVGEYSSRTKCEYI